MSKIKNIQKTAVVWIRDGVLVNRMYINPVAFAFASWLHILPEHKQNPGLITNLINFGFAKSGVSAAEKMQLFNEEEQEIIQNIEKAADDYDSLATKAAESADFFTGAVDLLRDLHHAGVLNFITSAVGQSVLDEWAKNDTNGQVIAPYLTEILGARPGFSKGKDHFGHIKNKYGVGRILYVADAISEVKTSRKYADEFNIIPVGFAHVITRADVMKGVELVKRAVEQLYKIAIKTGIDQNNLSLPDEDETKVLLEKAGADKIVAKGKEGIMYSLREYFVEANLIH